MLSFRNPGLFSSVGGYDASLMFLDLDEPSNPGTPPDDALWLESGGDSFLGPVFDVPRDIDYMLQHNPINILYEADAAKLDSLRSMRFHIHATYSDSVGNYSRNVQLVDAMAEKGIPNSFDLVVLAPDAVHEWGFADQHARGSLIKHWETFQESTPTANQPETIALTAELVQNYPNPFSLTTDIRYTLNEPGTVELSIYNLIGQKIKTLFSGSQPVGSYNVPWDGSDESGMSVPGGVYFYRMTSESMIQARKMVLLR